MTNSNKKFTNYVKDCDIIIKNADIGRQASLPPISVKR